jgi:hypothetical protein
MKRQLPRSKNRAQVKKNKTARSKAKLKAKVRRRAARMAR